MEAMVQMVDKGMGSDMHRCVLFSHLAKKMVSMEYEKWVLD